MRRFFHPTLLPLFDGVPRHILGVPSAGAHAYTTAMIGRWAGGALALWGMAMAVMPGDFLQIYQYNAKGGGLPPPHPPAPRFRSKKIREISSGFGAPTTTNYKVS